MLGTDQPVVVTGLHLHLALGALHRAGLSVADTLRLAAVLPARVFGADDLGTLTKGKLADAVIVDGDRTAPNSPPTASSHRPVGDADVLGDLEHDTIRRAS